jgi:hypothetical protein
MPLILKQLRALDRKKIELCRGPAIRGKTARLAGWACTRWHGTTMTKGLRPSACPTARADPISETGRDFASTSVAPGGIVRATE